MNFNDKTAIYLQIAGLMCDKILNGDWPIETKILSIRDLSVELEVNPNTTMRSFEHLQNKGIIYNKRGIGYFVATDGPQNVKNMLREEFVNETLPSIFKTMVHLNITINELDTMFNTYKQSQQK